MNPIELAQKAGFRVVNEGEGADRELCGIYCCDLLSVVMGRAKADDLWITVMGNINTIAVAVLSDVSCVLLSEGVSLDEDGMSRAKQQNVCVLATDLPTYEASAKAAALFMPCE